jgi:glycogen operon protein
MRNFLVTLFCSQGVPMLLGGDETGRTKQGNNNTYCQDNEITWHDWELDSRETALLDFTRRLVQTRRDHPSLRRRRFLLGVAQEGCETRDSTWYRPDGQEFTEDDWDNAEARVLGLLLNDDLGERASDGSRMRDDPLLLLLNAGAEDVVFTLPGFPGRKGWSLLVDSARPEAGGESHAPGEAVTLISRSCLLLTAKGTDRP